MLLSIAIVSVFSIFTVMAENETQDMNQTQIQNQTLINQTVDLNETQETNQTQINQSDDSINETIIDEGDVKVLSYSYGAQVRLEQLKNSIELKIENANEIIEEIEADENSTINTSGLNEIVDGYESLITQIDDLDMNQSSDVLAQEYVELKAIAIDLTQEFRILVKDYFSEVRKEQLRERFEYRKQIRVTMNDELHKYKNRYMAQVVQRNLNRLGLSDDELLAQVQNGTLTNQQIRDRLRDKLQNMTHEQIRESAQAFREDKIKSNIERNEILSKYRKNAQDIVEERGNMRNERNMNSRGNGDIQNRGSGNSGSDATGNLNTGRSSNSGSSSSSGGSSSGGRGGRN